MLVRTLSVFWHTCGVMLGILQTNEDFQGVTSFSSILSRRLRPKSSSRDTCPCWRATSGTCCLHGSSKMFCRPSWLICQRRQRSWSMTGRRRFACHLVRMKPVTCGTLSRNMPSLASAALPSNGKTVSGRSQIQRLGKDFIFHVLWFAQYWSLSLNYVLHFFCPKDIIFSRPTTSFWQKCENKLPKPPTAWLMPFSPSCQRHNQRSSLLHVWSDCGPHFRSYENMAHHRILSTRRSERAAHLEPLADLSKKLHWSALSTPVGGCNCWRPQC